MQNGREIAAKSELYQIYPNPFDQRTVIGINLAVSLEGILKISDMTGRTIRSIEKNWDKGYQEVWLDRKILNHSGVLFYSFESKSFRVARKMILKV